MTKIFDVDGDIGDIDRGELTQAPNSRGANNYHRRSRRIIFNTIFSIGKGANIIYEVGRSGAVTAQRLPTSLVRATQPSFIVESKFEGLNPSDMLFVGIGATYDRLYRS